MVDEIRKKAIDKVNDAFNRGVSCGYIYVPTGTGKSHITESIVVDELKRDSNANVMVVFKTRMEVEQFNSIRIKHGGLATEIHNGTDRVSITTYHQAFTKQSQYNLSKYSLFILCDADRISNLTQKLFDGSLKGRVLGVFSSLPIPTSNPFFGSTPIYQFEDQNSRLTEYWYINELILPILKQMGFENIDLGYRISNMGITIRPDIVATKDHIQFIIELKAYRSQSINQQIIWKAVQQVQTYKRFLSDIHTAEQRFGQVLLCDVDSEMKAAIWEKENIFIWDIKNLLYFCNSNSELLSALSVCIPYALNDIQPEAPLDLTYSQDEGTTSTDFQDAGNALSQKLKGCKVGKGNAVEYEKVCAEIIKYLFEAEFLKFSEQHKTSDSMFRMDILCALKGTTEFWRMLTHFYKTKFVVFEFKNYAKKIQQNLIYVTDKYLFNPALRNVAFIISRKGFDKHAHEAAMGILKDSGKLIIDLTDDDLLMMVALKQVGEEPSDYLLDKVERLLMSVSV